MCEIRNEMLSWSKPDDDKKWFSRRWNIFKSSDESFSKRLTQHMVKLNSSLGQKLGKCHYPHLIWKCSTGPGIACVMISARENYRIVMQHSEIHIKLILQYVINYGYGGCNGIILRMQNLSNSGAKIKVWILQVCSTRNQTLRVWI